MDGRKITSEGLRGIYGILAKRTGNILEKLILSDGSLRIPAYFGYMIARKESYTYMCISDNRNRRIIIDICKLDKVGSKDKLTARYE